VWKSPEFWVAVAVATTVKLRTSGRLTPLQALVTVAVAVGAAWAGSEWVSERFGIPEVIAAALVALTAEDIMRRILIWTGDPGSFVSFLRDWRK
jgi:hypothetical protein